MTSGPAEDLRNDFDESNLEGRRIEELPSDDMDSDFEDIDEIELGKASNPRDHTSRQLREQPRLQLPPWVQDKVLNLFSDEHITKTKEAQTKVTLECLPLLIGAETQDLPTNIYGQPSLRRDAHITFLHNTLQNLPAAYQAIDASRPWVFYWALAGLSVLGDDVSGYAERLADTARPMQHPQGGFGGGCGQIAHCACSYAMVLALATVDRLDVIDRKAMWHWLGRIKQADGGFRMAEDAEEDIRGSYCAMTVLTLLNLPLELPQDSPARTQGLTRFTDKLGEWVGRCQTYEGGIGGAPTNEAHGAYAFCALATLCILDAPQRSIPKYIDAPALVSWLAARQTVPEGGFAGRQEKLVDACYSHWVGGCWSLLEAGLPRTDPSEDIWNRAALNRYLLCCAQQPGKKGGMRDKPSTRPDGYHTLYSLVGLSHAQNNRCTYDDKQAETSDIHGQRLMAAFSWNGVRASQEERKDLQVDERDLVELMHPIFVIPYEAVDRAKAQFAGGGF